MTDKEYISELVDFLNYHTKLYDAGSPIISDREWDEHYFKLVEEESKTGIVLPNSPTNHINFDVVNSLNKVRHNHKMLSLPKTKDLNDILAFTKSDKTCFAMCKMDGLTCSLKYVDGKLVSAETRGDGIIGEDIFHNAKVVPNIPKTISFDGILIVDGEIISTYKNFERFNDVYKNPRNFAAGSIRLLDANECAKRGLSFVAWEVLKIIDNNNELKLSLNERLKFIQDLGFDVVPYENCSVNNSSETDMELIVNKIKERAINNSYPIDGVVFKQGEYFDYDNSELVTEHHFKNAIAYKFYDEAYDSVLQEIEWTMGRTGNLTPVAIFNPIEIDGSIVSRASLHNVSVMEEILGVPYNFQPIKVAKMNMIIPQIVSAEKSNPKDEDTAEFFGFFPLPKDCPYCDYELELTNNNGVKNLKCNNPTCPGKIINRLDHFCGKKGLDIKGLSEATLEKLLDWGWVNDLSDIFKLKEHREEWIKKSGFGPTSVDKILSRIEESRNTTLTNFISSLGIPLIGYTYAKELTEHIHTYEEFREKIKNGYDFSQFEGFAEAKTEALLYYDYTEADSIYPYLNIPKEENDAESYKENKNLKLNVVITGKLEEFKNRDELISKIESIGGKVQSSISGKTDMLINNDINSSSSKNKKAKNLGIPIITEKDFIKKYFS